LKLFTIGFTQTTAERFFGRLAKAGVRRLVDVRLNNVSQLAGFAKKDDLRYFVETILDIPYTHLPELAPTQEILSSGRKKGADWEAYERRFLDLMKAREVEVSVPRDLLDSGCLLCSEAKPDHCHRRLVAEYLGRHWPGLEIIHL
jgi:uncharacterized protein (DUF488 family)